MIRGKNKPHPEAARGRLRHAVASAWETFRDAIRNYEANGDTNQAAAIALYAILSIIPLFILTLLIINSLFSADPEIRGKLIEGIRQVIPSFSGELIIQIGRIEGKKEVLGGVGIISLIWFSAMIFGAIEQALNIIIRSKARRNYFVSKLLAIAMIPLGWAVGVASVGISYVAAILTEQPIFLPGVVLFLTTVEGFLFRYLLPYLAAVIFFTVVYKVIPTGKVALKSALIGSAVFSLLMEIAKQFFTWYVANYTSYNVIFGSLETVVILVIWVFYIALIFLFCAELISSYERRDMLLIEKAFLKPGKDQLRTQEQLLRKFGRFYGRDEYIFHEGDIDRDIFYILNGRIRMEKGAGQTRKVLAEAGPGEYFGEMAALISAPRNASARCLEECAIAVISGDTLHEILRENGEVSLLMLKEFANRLRHTDAALEELALSWIRLLVILYLLRSWPLSKEQNVIDDLAKAAGREKAEIEETLATLERSGVLTRRDGLVTGVNWDEALRLVDRRAATS
ncbi:MAG: YhjD/YihY/BrkB family envelope integrity protein [Syntrophales bacterium]